MDASARCPSFSSKQSLFPLAKPYAMKQRALLGETHKCKQYRSAMNEGFE